jgi:hypothetical protein
VIVQGLLDFMSQWLGAAVALIPPFPVEFQNALTGIQNGGAWLGTHIANLSPIVPFTVIYGATLAYLGALGFWVSMLALRLVLWMFNR